jgi:glucan phosphoethanolaminetransferase (alkaline phosphatase superfamily)
MSKKILLFTIFLLLGVLINNSALAVCPVCTIAVCVGVGLSRWLGIDDLISGVWIGGLTVSIIFWALDWLNKKQIRFKLRWIVVSFIFYMLVVLPLFFTGIMGHPLNKFLGIDKLLFGIAAGSLAFLLSVFAHKFLKKKNQGKSYFSYQKVILPVLFLIIISLIFYLTICK